MSLISWETRAEIAELNARFAWALDSHEYGALREVLAADVHYLGSAGEFRGVDAVIGAFRSRTGMRTTRHGLGNLLLAAHDDGRITGRSCWHTFASNSEPVGTGPIDGVGLSLVADFHDVYSRGPQDRWRISERIIRPIFRNPALSPGAAAAKSV